MSLAFRCEVCGGEPHWTLTRIGDVVTSWADDEHLAQVMDWLQRDFEVTRIEVRDHRKAVEWADLERSLESVANEPNLLLPPDPED